MAGQFDETSWAIVSLALQQTVTFCSLLPTNIVQTFGHFRLAQLLCRGSHLFVRLSKSMSVKVEAKFPRLRLGNFNFKLKSG